jgi:lysozyme
MDALDYALPLIKRFEGLRLSAYKCPAGVWTIGYGTTGPEVKEGDRWSVEACEEALREDCHRLLWQVRSHIKVPHSPQQMAALISFAYNLGIGALRKSTLLRRLNAGRYEDAAREFDKWVYAGGRKLPGLIKRRAAERALFEQGSA